MINTVPNSTQPHSAAENSIFHPLNNPNGSVMVIVLMVLTIMTAIGIVSSDMVVTENFIIRNVGIHKQNASLVDSALMRGLQEFMQLDNSIPGNFDPAPSVWINDRNITTVGAPEEFINTIWYETNFTRRCLNFLNSNDANTLPLLTTRGENANGNLRYAVVGWAPVPGMSITVGGGPTWRQGRIIAEYVSADAGGNDNGFGLVRQEMGVKQLW
jgi:hypothetical protein